MTTETQFNIETATYEELVREYQRLADYRTTPDRRWGEKRVRQDVTKLIDRANAEAARKTAQAEEAAAKKAALEAVAATRGDFEAFAATAFAKLDRSEEEGKLAYVASSILRQRKTATAAIAKFAVDVVENPSYALSWSINQFKYAAQLDVGHRVQRWIESGVEFSVIKNEIIRKAMQLASNSSRSTSATSNLMDDELRVAYVELAREFGFSYY
jgi:hypothetical protein